MAAHRPAISTWIARHAFVTWIGILLNAIFIAGLILDPIALLAFFDIHIVETLWPRFAGLLLLIVSIFYIPATINFRRYEVFAWLQVFPSRTFGAVFFALAVFLFDQPAFYLIGTALDGIVGLVTLFCLLRITSLQERAARLGTVAA